MNTIIGKSFKEGDEIICIKNIPDTNIIEGDPFIVKKVMCIYEDLPATNLVIKKKSGWAITEIVDIIKYSEYFEFFSVWNAKIKSLNEKYSDSSIESIDVLEEIEKDGA